jgi:hypothetical protein
VTDVTLLSLQKPGEPVTQAQSITIPGRVESVTLVDGYALPLWVVRVRLFPVSKVEEEFVEAHYPCRYHEIVVEDREKVATYIPGDPAAIVGQIVEVGT